MGKADLHIHTRCSDGLATVEDTLAYIEHETDLDVVAITDHEDVTGGLRARELAARRGYRVVVIPGAEITTLGGHVLALFLEENVRSLRSVEATLEAIHARGGLAIAPHPLSWLTRSLGERTLDRVWRRAEAGVTFDGIELANPSPAGRQMAWRAQRLNAARWRLPVTGSSDAHHLRHVAAGYTAFPGHTVDDFVRALRAGATEGRLAPYAGTREIGLGRTVAQLAWGYTATPRKLLGRLPRRRAS